MIEQPIVTSARRAGFSAKMLGLDRSEGDGLPDGFAPGTPEEARAQWRAGYAFAEGKLADNEAENPYQGLDAQAWDAGRAGNDDWIE